MDFCKENTVMRILKSKFFKFLFLDIDSPMYTNSDMTKILLLAHVVVHVFSLSYLGTGARVSQVSGQFGKPSKTLSQKKKSRCGAVLVV
jgi:hypothetical protein